MARDHMERVSSLTDNHIALHDIYCTRTLWANTRTALFSATVHRAVLKQRSVNHHLPEVQEIVYRHQLKLDSHGTETIRALASLV